MAHPLINSFDQETTVMKTHKMYWRNVMPIFPVLTLLVLHLFAASLSAQTTTSTIEGIVTDANGAIVAGAIVKVTSTTVATERTATSGADGSYRVSALPAGTYTITTTAAGFSANTSTIELTLNRAAKIDIQLLVGAVAGNVEVTDVLPLIEPSASSTGATVTPKQILDLPVNGREYLDLLQLVPGVAINRQASGGDRANPVLGERSGNNNFFIDGQPNKDTVNGGPAAAFNQETIAEFQVLTTGYRAEFGQASGAIVNVITKSGGNQFHGVGSFFLRNDALDSSNAIVAAEPGELERYNYSVALGGPIWKDKIFFFGSAERITEDRGVNFNYPTLPAVLDTLLHAQEDPFDLPARGRESRGFLKFNQNFGRHQLSQEINYTNENVKGSGSGLPSTRNNSASRKLLLGLGDTMLLGDQGNPWIVTLRGGYRGEPSQAAPTNPAAGPTTTFNSFTTQLPVCINPTTGQNTGCVLFGDLPAFTFGNSSTPSNLDQAYTSLSANANKVIGDHDIKFGWQFLRTKVDGVASRASRSQLFATVADFLQFGPLNSGFSLFSDTGGLSAEDDEIHLRNSYNGLYVQDDWKIRNNLTVNLGIRWDYDSEFEAKKNFAPRLGVAWAINPKTVIRGHMGIFYDQFRLGLVSNVPAFGGTDRRGGQDTVFPRLLYGSPSYAMSIAFLSGLPGRCFSPNLTDAQLTSMSQGCQYPGLGSVPAVGVDRLNRVVAPGHALIPANAVVNISNIQSLSGLTPDQFITQANAAINLPGFFTWGTVGRLEGMLISRTFPPTPVPVAVDSAFKTPNTLAFSVGLRRELTQDLVLEVDYHHREIRNLLGLRIGNLAYESRVARIPRTSLPGTIAGDVLTFGPNFEGQYDALIVAFNKRLSKRFMFGGSYTYAKATDNSIGVSSIPSDSFIGTVPLIVEPCPTTNPTCTPQTNANGSFISDGNFIAKAGTFSNGPDLDKGPSDLSLDHVFQVNGLIDLPWQFQIGGIFRAQSGFQFSRAPATAQDPDGNGNFLSIDLGPDAGRNAFTAPPFVNLDLRFSKRFSIGERVKAQVLLEYFNVFNRKNPSEVYRQTTVPANPFGTTAQVLSGREGQIGFRIEF